MIVLTCHSTVSCSFVLEWLRNLNSIFFLQAMKNNKIWLFEETFLSLNWISVEHLHDCGLSVQLKNNLDDTQKTVTNGWHSILVHVLMIPTFKLLSLWVLVAIRAKLLSTLSNAPSNLLFRSSRARCSSKNRMYLNLNLLIQASCLKEKNANERNFFEFQLFSCQS